MARRLASDLPVPPLQMFLVLLPILAPVFITVGAGFAFARWSGGFPSLAVTQLVTNIFAPCLIFSTLATAKVDPGRMALASGAILICMALAGVGGLILTRVLKAPIRTYLPASMLPNLGNIGGPICLFAFGKEGLAYAIAVMATGSLTMWTFGMWVSSGHMSLRRLFASPPVVAAFLGAAFLALRWHVPSWANSTLDLLAAPTFPLMLLALGASLAVMRVSSFRLSGAFGIYRVVAGTLIGILISELLGLQGVLKGVVILQSSMPAAVFNFLFAQMNDQRPEEVAGVIVVSTLLSVAALPFLVSYVLAAG